MLATTGFEQRQDIVKSTVHEPPPAPQGLKVARGALPGTLVVHARALPNVNVYNVQIATGDPSVEASWSDAGTSSTCNRNKTVYVRLRGFNRNGNGVWATSAGVVVL